MKNLLGILLLIGIELSVYGHLCKQAVPLQYFNGEQHRMPDALRPTETFDHHGLPPWAVVKAGHTEESIESLDTLGNKPPTIDIDIREGNSMFFFPNKPIHYAVRVVDSEDGSLADGRISPDRVTVGIEYTPTRFDSTNALLQTRRTGETPTQTLAQRLIMENDCRACHSLNKPGVGPTYERIAQKYKSDTGAVDRLARKIIAGGKGVWGDATMSPHPQLSLDNASTIVTYILSLSESRSTAVVLPVFGTYTPTIPQADDGMGYFRIWASYTDRGTLSAGPIRSEKVRFLRSPVLLPQQSDREQQAATSANQKANGVGAHSYWKYSRIDMTDISQLTIKATVSDNQTLLNGNFEVRLGSVTGKLIGKTSSNPDQLRLSNGSSSVQKRDIQIDLSPTTGLNDIYFVFINLPASSPKPPITIDAFVFN